MLSLDERAVNARLERMGSCGMWIAIPRIEDRAIEIGQYGEKGTKLSKRSFSGFGARSGRKKQSLSRISDGRYTTTRHLRPLPADLP
jgi:hypothetical protein